MKLYEDELEDHEKGVLAFVKREKQIVIFVVAFVMAALMMRGVDRQLDEAVAHEKAAGQVQGAPGKHNPWSKD